MTSNLVLFLGSSGDKKIAAIKPIPAKNIRIVVQQPRIKWIWFSVIELLHQSESCANVFVLKCHCEPVLQAWRLRPPSGTKGSQVKIDPRLSFVKLLKPLTARL
jgi:hypothetical protein